VVREGGLFSRFRAQLLGALGCIIRVAPPLDQLTQVRFLHHAGGVIFAIDAQFC
jgi:hypothetical protein